MHEKIFIKQAAKVFIPVNSAGILLVEACGGYAKIITTSGPYLVNSTLTDLEKSLPATHFCRVHRSYLVGIDHISSITNDLIRVAEREIPVSKAYEEQFLSLVKVVF